MIFFLSYAEQKHQLAKYNYVIPLLFISRKPCEGACFFSKDSNVMLRWWLWEEVHTLPCVSQKESITDREKGSTISRGEQKCKAQEGRNNL